jgi:glutathione S-transferase
MSALTLYYAPQSRSMTALWMLEEISEPYMLEVLDFDDGSMRTPEYLAINPMGKVPAVQHGDVIVTEAAAICTYLADVFPQAKLNIPLNDPRRGPYLKWLFFGPSCLEPPIIDKILNRPSGDRVAIGWGNLDAVLDTLTQALKKSPYLLGDQFTAADLVVGGGLRWGMMRRAVKPRPEFSDYAKRIGERPAAKRAFAREKEILAARKA